MTYKSPAVGNEISCVFHGVSDTTINNHQKIKEFIENKNSLSAILEQGKLLSEYSEKLVHLALETTLPIKIKIKEYIINAYNTPEFLRSHIGMRASLEKKQAVALFTLTGEIVRIHFRSNTGQTPNALMLAQALGGNGHANAAGARTSLQDFLKMIVSK